MGHDGEYTDIYYARYIDDVPLDAANVRVAIGPDWSITGFDASLVPVSSELYDAVTKKTIAEEEARKIVERDLKHKKNHQLAHKLNEPIFITKNGEGDMVVMSMAHYAKLQLKLDLFAKLTVAQNQVASGDKGGRSSKS